MASLRDKDVGPTLLVIILIAILLTAGLLTGAVRHWMHGYSVVATHSHRINVRLINGHLAEGAEFIVFENDPLRGFAMTYDGGCETEYNPPVEKWGWKPFTENTFADLSIEGSQATVYVRLAGSNAMGSRTFFAPCLECFGDNFMQVWNLFQCDFELMRKESLDLLDGVAK